MNGTIESPDERAVSSSFRVDVSRGQHNSRVSSEWFSRPDDERYLSLTDLHAAVHGRAQRATARTVETRAVMVKASRDDAERLSLIIPGREEPVMPTHWSFGQLCTLVSAPASYIRQLPATIAGINLQHGLLSHRAELVKTLEAENGRVELRAVTGPDYGRIWDHELVAAVQRIAGDGTGDTRWKVPGVLDCTGGSSTGSASADRSWRRPSIIIGASCPSRPATSSPSTDPQMAWHLARFIEQVRSIPADAIIVRQNWLRAYEFTTSAGAMALNDYARANDPFTKVGKQQIAVDVSSVIRASPANMTGGWDGQAVFTGSAGPGDRHGRGRAADHSLCPAAAGGEARGLRRRPFWDGLVTNEKRW